MNRTGLITLQVVGGLSILPYPAVLLANIMQIAAPGQSKTGAIPFVLLSVYPAVWIALYVFSWRAMGRGDVSAAFVLSSIPLFACLCVVAYWATSAVSIARFYTSAGTEDRKKIEPVNPLLWAIWCTGADHRFPPGPSIPVAQALQAIEANPTRVNLAVAPYGTPLKVAVSHLSLNWDGSPIGDIKRQQDLIQVVRSLVSHDARFGPDEMTDLQQQWRLKRALHNGPITTSAENPLVWRILTRKRDGVTLFTLHKDETPLLNVTTKLHGTPLYAALLQDGPDLYPELIKAGARLSPEEEQDPAAAAALGRVFQFDFELRSIYSKGH